MASSASSSYHFGGSMDTYTALEEHKRESPAAERNKQPILEVLQRVLPPPEAGGPRPLVLEVASGSGQHAAHFAAALPHLAFQPTDYTDELFLSIQAYTHGLPNVLKPLLCDVSSPTWTQQLLGPAPAGSGAAAGGSPAAAATAAAPAPAAIVCINMTHISPWAATQGLVRGAGESLGKAGVLFIYGPFKVDSAHTSEGNASFDASLRQRNPEWGYRDTADVAALAAAAGFGPAEVVPMPANNFSLIFRKLS